MDSDAYRTISPVSPQDLPQAIALVNRVFAEFVAVDYSEQGKASFEAYMKIKHGELSADLETGHKKMWVCRQEGEMAGVIAVRDASHIALLFVDKQYHRKGVARFMLGHVLEELSQIGGISHITVNSSPYAVGAYERLGFVKTDAQREKDGIKYIPMKMELPRVSK